MPRPSYGWLKLGNRSVWVPARSPAFQALVSANLGLLAGDRQEALRQLDRAWRIAPDLRGTVGPLYAQQLLEDSNPAAALAALRTAIRLDPRPDTAALLARALRALGRPAEPTPAFDFDGRASEHRGLIRGWVRNGPDPDAPLKVRFVDEHGNSVQIECQPHESGNSRQGFELRLKGSGLRGTTLRVSAVLPNKSQVALPDSPLLLPKAARSNPNWPKPAGMKLPAPARRKVDIVIPAYRNFADTVACIESVLASDRVPGDVVVIDDCSPEPKLSAWLKRIAAKKKIVLLRNEQNLGFSASINRGLTLHPERDVLALNSDTLVFGDWLARLRAAAHSTRSIGTATPLTNDGSIASLPRYTATELTASQGGELDQLAARVNRGVRGELPVGVGFCLYLKRECLNAAGNFDAAVFGTGYGEEVDLCMRASSRGFRHVLAADTFVLHKGGGSFGKRREALLERNQRLIDLRHPRFQALVNSHDRRDPLRSARRRIAEAQVLGDTRQRTLIVSLAMSGGVERFVEEREHALKAGGTLPLVLRTDNDRTAVVLLGEGASKDLRYELKTDLPALMDFLRRIKFSHVELDHFLGLPARLVEAIRQLRAPMDIYIHDYVWICPQITLIDKRGHYCGEPELSVCERCILQKKPNLPEKIGVGALRRRSARWLSGARRVIAPSADVVRRLTRYFPGLHVELQPWQQPPRVAPRFVPPGARVRVALMGAIGQHKGYDLLMACARDATARELPLEFTVLGFTDDDASLIETGRVFVTGSYREQELGALLRRENPHVILLPSVWPETWSYTLTYALQTGLPTVAFDLGAIAERMRSLQRGLLLPLHTRPAELNDHLLRLAMNPTQ